MTDSTNTTVDLINVKLPEEENEEDAKSIATKSREEKLNMDKNVIEDIDKFHRTGHIKKNEDKKTQNINVQFKSHSSCYECLKNKKKVKNHQIGTEPDKEKK